MASLPKSFNLFEAVPSLPDGATSTLVTCRPISGSSFTPQSIIECDLGNRGWVDPQSISIRYRCVTVADSVSTSCIAGTPVYTPFQRISTLVGGAAIDSVNSYGQTAHLLTNVSKSVSSKYGCQSLFGYGATTANATLPNMDGRASGAGVTDTFFMAAPLVGLLLTGSDKMLPLFAMPQIRFQLTLDALANMCFTNTGATGYNNLASLTINNFELCYSMIDLGAGIEAMVYDHGAPLMIKSHGFNNSSVSVAAGTSGSNSYVFNQRFQSIRSAFICPSALIGSKQFEFVDLTSGNGDYQLVVGQTAIPQSPLSTVLNRSGILLETRRAVGNIYTNDEFSINAVEFGVTVNTTAANLVFNEPGKFICGLSLEKCASSDHVLLSGMSTYNSPITCNINIQTATTQGAQLSLVLNYDAVLVLDAKARQLSVRS